MITTGQSITNSVTGETLVFRTTSADSNGERVVVETFVEPNGAVAAAHVHPAQEELFEVLAGELEFRVGKDTIVAKPGDRVLVPAGTAHRFENIGDETAHFVCEVSPALGFEQLIETMFSLAEDGKVNEEGDAEPAAAGGHRQATTSMTCGCRSRPHGSSGSASPSAPRSAGCSATSRPTSPPLRRPRRRSASSAPPRSAHSRPPARPARPAERRAPGPHTCLTTPPNI